MVAVLREPWPSLRGSGIAPERACIRFGRGDVNIYSQDMRWECCDHRLGVAASKFGLPARRRRAKRKRVLGEAITGGVVSRGEGETEEMEQDAATLRSADVRPWLLLLFRARTLAQGSRLPLMTRQLTMPSNRNSASSPKHVTMNRALSQPYTLASRSRKLSHTLSAAARGYSTLVSSSHVRNPLAMIGPVS